MPGKVALEPGYSLMAWMRLSASGSDLTGGVGVGEETEWTCAEVKQHNTADNAWMVIRGWVYNIGIRIRVS